MILRLRGERVVEPRAAALGPVADLVMMCMTASLAPPCSGPLSAPIAAMTAL